MDTDSLTVEQVPVGELEQDPANARRHGPKNLQAIKASLRRFGQQKPIVVSADGVVVAGNGTLEAARELGWKQIAVVRSGLSGAELIAYGIADNRSGELAEWDLDTLADLLGGLRQDGVDLLDVGYDEADIAALLGESEFGDLEEEDIEASDGSLLAIADVTIAEPRHEVSTGDVYRLGHHTLLCVDVMKDWEVWQPHLEAGAMFAPYPGPYAPLVERAEAIPLVMVQPDTYIAGHILDKWAAIHGDATISKASR